MSDDDAPTGPTITGAWIDELAEIDDATLRRITAGMMPASASFETAAPVKTPVRNFSTRTDWPPTLAAWLRQHGSIALYPDRPDWPHRIVNLALDRGLIRRSAEVNPAGTVYEAAAPLPPPPQPWVQPAEIEVDRIREIDSDTLDRALHDMGDPAPAVSKQWLRTFWRSAMEIHLAKLADSDD